MNSFSPLPMSSLELAARWRQLVADWDSSERFELSADGEIVEVVAPSVRHQIALANVQVQIREQLGGHAIPSLPVLTPAGVLLPDVSWVSSLAIADSPLMSCPKLVVEVLMHGQRQQDVVPRVKAYLDAGAAEVAVVQASGLVRFHRADGEFAASAHRLLLSPMELPT